MPGRGSILPSYFDFGVLYLNNFYNNFGQHPSANS